jgi:hypothetical protein
VIARWAAAAAVVLAAVTLAAPPAVADATAGAPQGNVTPILQPQTGVGVAAQSAPTDGRVALVVQNGTQRPVRIERITAVASRADGSFATRARSVVAYPQIVAPGGISLASVRFRKAGLRPDDEVTVKVRSAPVRNARAGRVLAVDGLSLSPVQTGTVVQTMTATLTNPTRRWTAARPEAAVVCFGEAGNPSTFASARASTRRVKPGASATVTVPLTSLCPSYLVAARAT